MNKERFLTTAGAALLALAAQAAGPVRAQAPDPCRGTAVLTIEAGEPDADFNGRLVRVELDGTGRRVLFERASDVYPQDDGSLFVKSRTSRSGHDLFYIAPGGARDAARIAAAFDFVDAAIGPDGRRAALVARTGPALEWEIEIVGLRASSAAPLHVALPAGVRPERLRWPRRSAGAADPAGGGEMPVLIGTRDGRSVRFGLAGMTASPRWDDLPGYAGSEADDFVLNKSQTLSVRGLEADGSPAIRVEYAWWHGATDEIVTIPGLELVSYEWACGHRSVFILGRKDGLLTALTVDLAGKKVLTALKGAREPVKLLKTGPLLPRVP